MRRRALAIAVLFGSVGIGVGQQPADADLVVLNARIVTVDPAFTLAEAVAIRGGRFTVVGRNAQVRPLIGKQTRVIDARGRTVIPGLIDTHVHATGVAAAEAIQPFRELDSIDAIQAWLRTQAARTPAGTWIWSPRLYPTRLGERRFPTRQSSTWQHVTTLWPSTGRTRSS